MPPYHRIACKADKVLDWKSSSSRHRAAAVGGGCSDFNDRYQPAVPGSPLNGPTMSSVTQPP
jgi:hypothetical protein